MSKRVANKKGGGGARSGRTNRLHVAAVRGRIDTRVGGALLDAVRNSRQVAADRQKELVGKWQTKSLWQRAKDFVRRGVR